MASGAAGRRPEAGASIGICVATLLKNMIGAGIFSLPMGLKLATPLPGLAILACVGVMNAVSYWMVGYCCLAWGVSTFRELWYRTLGTRTAWVIDVTILLNGWFTLVGYLVLIGDFATKSLGGLLGEDHLLARSRLLDQWAVTLLVLMPLSMAQDLRRLAFTSVLGLVVLAYVVLLMLHESWVNSPPGGGDCWGPEAPLAEWRAGAFEAAVLYTHAFVAHYNAPKLFGELARPTSLRWLIVVVASYATAIVVYAAFSFAGLRRFQGGVLGNVLRNFNSEASVLVAWLGMGFSIAFTYPIVFNSAREACVNLLAAAREAYFDSPRSTARRRRRLEYSRRTPSLHNVLGPDPPDDDDDADTSAAAAGAASDPQGSPSAGGALGRGGHLAISIGFVLLTAVCSSLTSDLGFVNAVTGSLMGCAVAFVFPSMLFFGTVRAQLAGGCGGSRAGLQQPLLGQRKKDDDAVGVFDTLDQDASPRAAASAAVVGQASRSVRPWLRASLLVAVAEMVSGAVLAVLGLAVALGLASESSE